jgi:dUTP pyrophosphatase
MKVKIKKLHESAVVPKYAKPGDAGMDITATEKFYDEYGNVTYKTGIAIEIPEGYVGFIFPRSSNSKMDLLLSNSVGVIDSGYRGEIMFKFKPSSIYRNPDPHIIDNVNDYDYIDLPERIGHETYNIGDRIGQIIIMPYPKVEFIEVDELSSTERGEGGFGSTN